MSVFPFIAHRPAIITSSPVFSPYAASVRIVASWGRAEKERAGKYDHDATIPGDATIPSD
jgi:hypothetical protein